MTEEHFNADEDEEQVEELQPLDMDDMDDLMEEMEIDSTDVPSEPAVEELMEEIEDIQELSQDESFFEDLDDNEEVIPEIPDSPQPMNNLGVDEVEVDAIKQAMEANYLSEVLDDDELMGLLPNEVVTPIFVPEGEAKLDGKQLLLQNLESVIGDRATNLIAKIASMNDGGLSDVVSMTPLSDIARIDILDDRDGRPRFIQLVDINGADVTSILNLPVNSDGEVEVQQVIDNSVFTNLENDSINRYKADGMGGSIMNALEEFKELIGEKERRQQRVDLLKWMRTLIFKLNDVFGFDDYKQLEALIAAWLMKNSTCRLSGIPGTGKTTVIECASTLLANSYGYHTSKTYSAGEQYLTNLGSSADPRNFFGDNSSSDNIYQPLIFEKGMYYDINYNQKSYADTAGVWENWRFTSWSHPPLDASSNYNYSAPQRSGSYLYNFKFLRNQEEETTNHRGDMLFPPVDSKREVTIETYRNLLQNCWEVRVPKDFDIGLWNDMGTNSYADHPNWDPTSEAYAETEKEIYVKPIKILDDQGQFIAFEQGSKPSYGPFEMSLRNAKVNSSFYGQIMGSIPTGNTQRYAQISTMKQSLPDADAISQRLGFNDLVEKDDYTRHIQVRGKATTGTQKTAKTTPAGVTPPSRALNATFFDHNGQMAANILEIANSGSPTASWIASAKKVAAGTNYTTEFPVSVGASYVIGDRGINQMLTGTATSTPANPVPPAPPTTSPPF